MGKGVGCRLVHVRARLRKLELLAKEDKIDLRVASGLSFEWLMAAFSEAGRSVRRLAGHHFPSLHLEVLVALEFVELSGVRSVDSHQSRSTTPRTPPM